MAGQLVAARAQLGTVLSAMGGLTRYYSNPPESISEFPALLVFPLTGSMEIISDGWGEDQHTFQVLLYQSREILPDAIAAAEIWPDLVRDALAGKLTLNGTVSTVMWPLTYRCGPLRYNRDVHYGVIFNVRVKINPIVTTAA